MQIPETILAECHSYGVENYPEESCGFIIGNIDDYNSLEIVYPMRNIINIMHEKDPKNYPLTAREGYVIDPIEHLKLERSLKKLGKRIKVIYHSHPDVGAYFSEKDKNDALWNGNARYPGITYLVCATNKGNPGDAIIANFNVTKKDFEIKRIPEKNCTSSTEKLGGNFGISGILPNMNFIHEWKNGNLEPEYGYFRFVPHKQVKKLQERLAIMHQTRHALAYSSAKSSLMELISYLKSSNALHTLHLAPKNTIFKNALASLEIIPKNFNLNNLPEPEKFSAKKSVILIAPGDLKNFIRKNTEWLEKLKKLRVLVIAFEEANSKFWRGGIQDECANLITFLITGLKLTSNNHRSTSIKGGLILSNNDRQIAELSEFRKRRGAILSARNASLFLGKLDGKKESIKNNFKNSLEIKKTHVCFYINAVTKKLCEWENASSGLLFPSGMAAIMALITLLQKKEKTRLIVIGLLYSDTYSLLMDSGRFPEFDSIFLGLDQLDLLPEILTNETAMIITESITNPLCEIPDLERIGKLANENEVPFLVDNTLASPANCQPINWGADYVIHSTTKFLSGTNDHAGGAILIKCQEKAYELKKFQKNWGLEISTLEAKVLHKRMRDFFERMIRFNENNLTIANFLKSHSAVDRVYYAFSNSKCTKSTVSKFLSGSGGVVSFVLRNDSEENLRNFYDGKFSSIIKAPTLGSNQTLVCPYTTLTHYRDTDKDLLEIGLPRNLIRIASGSEKEINPIIKDLNSALSRTNQ
mgnify:CR=1 FL=1